MFVLFSAISIPAFTLFIAGMSLFLSHRRAMKLFRSAIRWYGIIIIKILPFPLVKIHYKDYAASDKQPSIFVANHRSASDPFLIACLPGELVQVVNTWPFRIPVLGLIARLAGYLSINEMPFEEFSRQIVKLLNQGVSIVTFPEGTRSAGKAMGQFHGSIFRIALQAKFPIVPVCITGNEKIPLKGLLRLRPGNIKVHKLSELKWEEYKDLKPFKLKNMVRDIMAAEIALMEQSS